MTIPSESRWLTDKDAPRDVVPLSQSDAEACVLCTRNRSACMNTDCRGDGLIPNRAWQQAHPEWKYDGPPLEPFGGSL